MSLGQIFQTNQLRPKVLGFWVKHYGGRDEDLTLQASRGQDCFAVTSPGFIGTQELTAGLQPRVSSGRDGVVNELLDFASKTYTESFCGVTVVLLQEI